VASAFAVRRAVGRAAYYFTLRVLWRSVPHRASMAAYAAAGVAIALLTVRGIDLRQPADVAAIPPGILALQTTFVSVLIVGFRHAVRVPAELGANWIFQLTTSRDERPFLTGVKRAAVVALALPTLLAWLPLHLWLLGARAALAHFAFGLLLALLLLDALLLGFRRLPFTFGYTPNGNLRFLGPLYILAFATATYLISRAEQLALASTSSTIAFLAVMVTLVAAIRALHRWSRHEEVEIEFDEMPTSTQRLDLSG
jgi:hypothetical protein